MSGRRGFYRPVRPFTALILFQIAGLCQEIQNYDRSEHLIFLPPRYIFSTITLNGGQNMAKSLVSISRCESIHDPACVFEAVKESTSLIGGLETLINRGDFVLIKPNVLCAKDYKTGATTNPHVVKSLCRLAREAGAGKIVIAESSTIGCDTLQALEACGYAKVAQEEGVELIDLKRAPSIYMGIPNGKVIRRLEVPKVVFESDIIINVPAMKTHDMLPVTLGLKNMKGTIKDKYKKRFHVWGLAQAIIDLNKLLLPQITVIDGTVAMEGLGPMHGDPVNLGLIISSFDTVAADAVGAYVMGIDPGEVEYLQLAEREGLGCANLSEINVAGIPLEKAKRPFKQLRLDLEKVEKELGIAMREEGACSGCRQVVETLIHNYLKGNLHLLREYTLIFGQTVKVPDAVKGKLLNFGSCTKKYRNRGEYIPGCPPMQEDVLEFFGMDPNTWVD